MGYCAPEIACTTALVPRQLCYTDKTDIYALGKTLNKVMSYLFSTILKCFNNTAHAKSCDLYRQLIHVSNMMCFEAPEERLSVEYVRILLFNVLWQSTFADPQMNEMRKKESFNLLATSQRNFFLNFETVTCLKAIIHLTGVMIMRRTDNRDVVESKTSLSRDFFNVFCKLDLLLTSDDHRSAVLSLYENVNHALNKWDSAGSPSPILIFEQEMAKSGYAILRDQLHPPATSFAYNFFSGMRDSLPSVLAFVNHSPMRRERSNQNDDEGDNSFSP